VQAVRAKHPHPGRIIDAIAQVLNDEGDAMQARDVHAAVQTLLGEPVRWASVKATLAGAIRPFIGLDTRRSVVRASSSRRSDALSDMSVMIPFTALLSLLSALPNLHRRGCRSPLSY
jgi:hypothetical protein